MIIKSTKDITATSITALIYGDSGTGKTTLSSTLKGNTLIVSLESGLLSLKDFKIDYVAVEGNDGAEKIMNLREIVGQLSDSKYNNIYIDSMTELSQCFLEYAQKEYPDDRQTLKRYGYVKELMVKFIKYMRDLDKNVFFTALEKTDKDEMSRRYTKPDLVGSISSSAPGYFDLVFRLEVFEKEEETVRALLTRSKAGIIAKDRSGKLDEYEHAHLGAVLDKIFNKG